MKAFLSVGTVESAQNFQLMSQIDTGAYQNWILRRRMRTRSTRTQERRRTRRGCSLRAEVAEVSVDEVKIQVMPSRRVRTYLEHNIFYILSWEING